MQRNYQFWAFYCTYFTFWGFSYDNKWLVLGDCVLVYMSVCIYMYMNMLPALPDLWKVNFKY